MDSPSVDCTVVAVVGASTVLGVIGASEAGVDSSYKVGGIRLDTECGGSVGCLQEPKYTLSP